MEQLKQKNPAHDFDIQTISTAGDTDPRPLFTIDQKGIFEKEVDKAVHDGGVDFAVHSLKDVPSSIPSGLELACIPLREQVNDVLVSVGGDTLESIRPGSVVGTSSLRRAVQVTVMRSDLQVRPIRGNIETRIAKSDGGGFDAIILAKAGISRLGLRVRYHVLDTTHFMPSPGQGALALVCRADDHDTVKMLKSIEDRDSRMGIEAERAMSSMIDSGCRFPVGAYGRVGDRDLLLQACAFSVDGKTSILVKESGPKADAVEIGMRAGRQLQDKGIEKLALNWREKVEEWNKK